MKNDRKQAAEIRAYFAEEPVPEPVHRRLLETCRALEPRPQPEKRRFPWKRLAVSASSVAAAFLVLCGTNAVNPAFAESLPLVGRAFQLYNSRSKLAVGSYVGTYPHVDQPNAQALAEEGGMVLTLAEAYSDGEFIHLSFVLEDVPQQVSEDLDCLSGRMEAQVNGVSLEEAYLSLYPQGETLAGTVSLALQADASEGEKLELSYRVGDLTRSYKDYQQEESVDGAFSGQITVTVDTSHNQRVEDFTSNGEVQVNWVEATPSYTQINYTIPNWGQSGGQVDYPALFLPDGTRVQGSLEGFASGEVSPQDTVTTTAWFDGLPNGTQQVILRFFDEQCPEWQPGSGQAPMFYPGGGGEAVEVRVLAEATIDLSTGEASPSQTYQEEGLSYAGDYRQSFRSLRWTLPFDDRDMVQLGQADWSSVTAIPGLFQNGKTLWSLVYDKENGQMEVRFATDGPAPEGVWNVTVTGEDGAVAAQGTLSPDGATLCRSGDSCYYEWDVTLEAQGELQLLETVTVTLSGPDSGETAYQREVRLSEREW